MTDPRHHRHAVAVRGDTLHYACGCRNEVSTFGALRSVAKCDGHRREAREAGELGDDYYRSNGALDDDAPSRYEAELAEVLGTLPAPPVPGAVAMEVGCGASPYVRAIRRAGWAYHGLDASAWACEWMRCRYGADMTRADFAAWTPTLAPGLILCAHAIEHMHDAPAAILKMADMLTPGGELWAIVPDDSDPINPDHIWTMHRSGLQYILESAGMRVYRLDERRRIEREKFIYCRAIKTG